MPDLFIVLVVAVLNPALLAPGSPDVAGHSIVDTAVSQQRLERLDERTYASLVRNRHGRALLVNFWATWCGPCVEEFPDIVRLAEEMKGRDIDFVGVSADDFDDESAKVIPFIAKHHAPFRFYMAKIEGEDSFIDSVDKKWGGGIPATFVYDAQGHRQTFLLGKQTYARLKAAILRALAP